VLIAEDGHHAARTLLRNGQIVHEHPDQDKGQCRRNGPEVTDGLQINLLSCRIDERGAEESAEARAEEHRCCQVDEGYTEIADACVDAEGKALLCFWKEEAEPVAEEFRDSTWEVFKEISNKIHERKSELLAQIEVEQQKALEKKNEIIAKLKDFVSSKETLNHNFWQQAIKQVEQLRSEFLKLGNVPKKLSKATTSTS